MMLGYTKAEKAESWRRYAAWLTEKYKITAEDLRRVVKTTDWNKFSKAYKWRYCDDEQGYYFGCPCEGDPMHKCPRGKSHVISVVRPEYKGTALVGFSEWGYTCPRWAQVAQEAENERKAKLKAERLGTATARGIG